MQSLKAISRSIINLIYPMHCFGCNRPLEALNEFHICDRCVSLIKLNAMPPAELDKAPSMAYSACLYEGVLKELVHSFKYKGKTSLAKIFSKLMMDYMAENPEMARADLVTVVPLHKRRLREREFNQSLLLANPISKEFSIPLINTLEKTRATKYQNELSKSERLGNLKRAFAMRKGSHITGKNILLIDDIITTGATLGECADTLLSGGARSVTCFALARGI